MGGAIRVALHRDRRCGDLWGGRETLIQVVVFRYAIGQAQTAAVVMDHDGDMVGIVEGGSGTFIGGVIELPAWRRELPDQLVEVMPVLVIAGTSSVGGEVELIPPL